jgi:hypothetical protein
VRKADTGLNVNPAIIRTTVMLDIIHAGKNIAIDGTAIVEIKDTRYTAHGKIS